MDAFLRPGRRGGAGRGNGAGDAAARIGLAGSISAEPEPPPSEPWFQPRAWSVNARATWSGFRKVLGLVWQASRPLTLALVALNLLQGLTPAAQVYLAKLLIDVVVRGISTHAGLSLLPSVAILVAAQFAVGAVSSLASTVANIAQQLLQERVSNRVQLLLMEHANNLDLAFFEQPRFYDLIQQVQREATFRPTFMVQTAFGLIRQVLTFVSMLALLLRLEWFVAAAALLAPIPAFVASARYGWQGYQMSRRQSPLRRMMAYLMTVLTTDQYAKEVRLFTIGQFFVRRYQELFDRYYAEQKALVVRRYLVGATWSLLSVLANGLTFLYVAFRALQGAVTVGDLTLYVQAASNLSQSFTALLGGVQSMYEHQLYLTSLFDLLTMEPRVAVPPHPRPIRRPLREGIEFRNVTYTYDGQSHPALENVSFSIEPGESVAIVGHNGAGKTTLVKLLTRLYDPQEGAILLDGHDVREYDPDELRREFGVLFQDYVSYQLSARENIGVGRVEILSETPAVVSAAAKSGAAPIIERLPQGYDTVLGKWFDGGVNLSGGEWQKVALGRAFMRSAQILILDEPSAALDAKAENELFERLHDLAEGRTAIFISHRFSTVRRADRILVFEHGRLVEQGTHDELMAIGGRYAELFELQASSYR